MALTWGLLSPGISGSSCEAAILVLGADREIRVESTHSEPQAIRSTDLGPFGNTLSWESPVREGGKFLGQLTGSALIDSRIESNRFAARGHGAAFASGDADDLMATGRSSYRVTFELDTPSLYVLDGRLTITPRGTDLLGSSGLIRLTGPEGVLHEVTMGLREADIPAGGEYDFLNDLGFTGMLEPGRYTLEAYSQGVGIDNRTRCVDYEVRLVVADGAQVPEPSSGLCCGLALAGCLLLRRRRRAC